jgi:hypothetical protein
VERPNERKGQLRSEERWIVYLKGGKKKRRDAKQTEIDVIDVMHTRRNSSRSHPVIANR